MDNDTGAEPLPKTEVTDKHRKEAQETVNGVLQRDANRLLELRYEECKAAAKQARGGSGGGSGPWPQPHAADDYFEQGAQAAEGVPDQPFVRGDQQDFQRAEDDSDDDEGSYGGHSESDEEDGYRCRRDPAAGDVVPDTDYYGRAGVSAKELPWTMACNKDEMQKLKCAFCKTEQAACIQSPEHLYNETYAKQQHRFPERDAFHLNNDALDRVKFCAERVAGKNGERRRCREARAVCKERLCRISAGMLDAEAEAKWLSYTPVNKSKFNFNQRHDCPQILVRSLCKLRLVVVREVEEGSFDEKVLGRCMKAALEDLAQISYWMCIQQKYFITAGTLLTAESVAFGLRLDDDARTDLAEKMARVPARMFVALLKEHLLDVVRWTGVELGYGPNNGDRKSWYWEIMKKLLGRCWPNPLFVAYVELKVRQWIAMDCPFDAQGRPRFVLKQQRHDPLLTDFWDGPDVQSKLLAPVFEHAKAIMGRLNKPSARSGYWSNAFKDIQQSMKAGGRQTQLWQVMVIARALADPIAESRANAPLVIKNKIPGKEFAIRDNSFITSYQDLDMLGCLNSAALGLRLAEAKDLALTRALPKGIRDAAAAKKVTVGAHFVSEYLQVLTLVRIGSSAKFAVGPKPEILDESGTRQAVVNSSREKAASHVSRLAGVAAGIGKRVVKGVFGRQRPKRVDECERKGLLTNDPTQMTREMEGIYEAQAQSQYAAPGLAMDGVVRQLVCIFEATGDLPTLATHPMHFDQLCAKMGPSAAQFLMVRANEISAAHMHFNLIRAAKGVITSKNFNIMAPVTTADVLFPGQQPGQSDAAWKARKVELIRGWKSDVRVMLRGKQPSQQHEKYQHPMLHPFFAPYTPALEKELGSLEAALAQFLQPVSLPAPLQRFQMRARPPGLAALPPDDPWHERQRGATAQWEANYARDVHAGRVEDTEEAKTAYFMRDAMHPEFCVEMALRDLRASYRDVCDALARREEPATAPSYDAWLKAQRIDTDGLDYRFPDEEQRRLKFAQTVVSNEWAKITKIFSHQLRTPQPAVFDAEGKKVDPKHALCKTSRKKAKALFFELYPRLCEMVRDGPHADGEAYNWYREYFAERHKHSGGAGSRYFRERQDAAKDPTGMSGIKHLYATHAQLASVNAILAHKGDKAKLDAITAHLERMAGLRPPLRLPNITAADVQDAADRSKNGDDGGGDNADDSDDDPGPGDAAAVGQKRPSRKKAKPTTVDQRHTKKKKHQAQKNLDAHELGLKDEPAVHYDALKMSKKEQVHPATLLPPKFANDFRAYNSKIWGGDPAPSPAKKARAKKAPAKAPAKKAPGKKAPAKKVPAKKAPGKKAPTKASMRQRRIATFESSDDDDDDDDDEEESDEEGRDSSDSEDEDDATLAKRNAAQAEKDEEEAAAHRHLFKSAD